MSERFQRRKEDFSCEHCGAFVAGSGFTNHCPRCLWSKHVDVYPGDRSEPCGGLMEPVELQVTRGGYAVVHRCTLCGSEKKNKTAPGDALEFLL